MDFVEYLKDKWLTYRTGMNAEQRMWRNWLDQTIVYRASTVENYFMNFKHIIEVDPDKFWNPYEPFGWVPVKEFKQYEWPNRQLGDNAVGNWFRGDRNPWDQKFHIDECFGRDHVFVATNNDRDAIMIALRFS